MTKLTRDQIRAMPASREMDALIQEYVMKCAPSHSLTQTDDNCWECEKCGRYSDQYDGMMKLSCSLNDPYSTFLPAAFTAFTSAHRAVNLTRVHPNSWEASMIDVSPIIIAEANTAPLAICRMLLLAGLDK